MSGYTPGEQPRDSSMVKLNTNESPYPPSPRVAEAVQAVLADGRLRRYPDRRGTVFRQCAAGLLDVDPDALLLGNGSDDILTIVTRAFVPEGGLVVAPMPTYPLYRILADIQGARFEPIRYAADWSLPDPFPVSDAHLTLVANPNSPSGTSLGVEALARLAECVEGPLLIDEAYADFAAANALALARRPNVIVTRSLSKSYGLAGARFGFAVTQPELVRELEKVKDSFNCDSLSLVAAAAAFEDQEHLRITRARVLRTRERMWHDLTELGFDVTPSQANFLWCRRSDRPARAIYEELRVRQILVRYMTYEGYGDGLRITVGTDEQVDLLVTALRQIV